MSNIVVAMSGGVDSSVTAALLKKEGHHLIGVTMKIWDGSGIFPRQTKHHGCYGPGEEEDIADARTVAEKLDMPFHIFDLTQEYRTEVLDYVRREYGQGRTPNPCLVCNARMKFGTLIQKVLESGIEFDYFATGHYVRQEYDLQKRRYLLKKGKDPAVDQSYFLFDLNQEQLRCSIFPVGGMTKREVRDTAVRMGLSVAEKPKSQSFISGGHQGILEPARPGPVKNSSGQTLGQHSGTQFYTIGQRKGLGVSRPEPLFVTAIDDENNVLTVGKKQDLYQKEFTVSALNWIACSVCTEPIRAEVKIRYREPGVAALIVPQDNNQASVIFDEPQAAITPGQAAVFYHDDIVLGGGFIDHTKMA